MRDKKFKILKRAIVALLIFAGMMTLWRRYWEPQLYIEALAWTEGDHGEIGAASQRLAALGPRAIGPILDRIGSDTPYAKSAAALLGTLKRIGEPAHVELLAAIDTTADSRTRRYYIYTLQVAFKDYSRLPRWLEEAKQAPDDYWIIQMSLARTFGFPVPQIKDGQAWNPDFLDWYKRHSKPKGILPVWSPQTAHP